MARRKPARNQPGLFGGILHSPAVSDGGPAAHLLSPSKPSSEPTQPAAASQEHTKTLAIKLDVSLPSKPPRLWWIVKGGHVVQDDCRPGKSPPAGAKWWAIDDWGTKGLKWISVEERMP
jgi:hypothetical protein